MKTNMLFPILFTALAAGCASPPVVDPATAHSPQYRADLEECRYLAQRGGSGRDVATTGAAGAAAGAVAGEIAADKAGKGAAIGALAGIAAGAFSADKDEDRIIRQCLRDRGYDVY